VILLDEIEKAHPDILNILLQVFEDGQITDAYGEEVDFKNTLVIMTSNLGSQHIVKTGGRLGFKSEDADQTNKDSKDMVMGVVRRSLSPEFINRIDEIIVFSALSEDQLEDITQLMVRQLNKTLEDRGFEVEVSDEVCKWLVDTTCRDRSYGARPLRRAIQRHIEDELSEALLQGQFHGKGRIEVFLEGERVAFRKPTETPA
jgi:ATP-dependent Clp protease ATP-binding subunit ClpC